MPSATRDARLLGGEGVMYPVGRRREWLKSLSDEACQHLQAVVKAAPKAGRGVAEGVSAARGLNEIWMFVEGLEQKPLLDLRELLGDDVKALAWMLEKVPELQARIAARAKELTDGRAEETAVAGDTEASRERGV